MLLRKWDFLPDFMQNEAIRPYYDTLSKHQAGLVIKRLVDIAFSLILLLVLWPVMLVLALCIKLETKGPVIFKQERITAYGQKFKIYKFRTMVYNADKIGGQVTIDGDRRITKVGRLLRRSRLDELPQLINILKGEMSFVGTRPEVEKYVAYYTEEMMATLLLPAGVTSEASILFKDESQILNSAERVDEIYVSKILPQKMYYSLEAIRYFCITRELKTMFKTVLAVLGILKTKWDIRYKTETLTERR